MRRRPVYVFRGRDWNTPLTKLCLNLYRGQCKCFVWAQIPARLHTAHERRIVTTTT